MLKWNSCPNLQILFALLRRCGFEYMVCLDSCLFPSSSNPSLCSSVLARLLFRVPVLAEVKTAGARPRPWAKIMCTTADANWIDGYWEMHQMLEYFSSANFIPSWFSASQYDCPWCFCLLSDVPLFSTPAKMQLLSLIHISHRRLHQTHGALPVPSMSC